MFSLKKFTTILLALTVLISGLAFTVQPALAATCTQYHTVRRGETLYSIGLAYGVSWRYLADINNLANPRVIYAGTRLCVSTDGTVNPTPQPTYSGIPTFSIVSVVMDKSVTIRTNNLPANDTFNVLIGGYGTRGVNGTKVSTVQTGKGGTLNLTVNIPAALAGSRRLAIRMESPTSGYFAYNWFWNNQSGTGTGGGTPPSTGYSGFPTFSISSVARDKTVTIRTSNLPASDTFQVTMNAYGTRGIGGYVVDTVKSGNGGSQTLSFSIPAALAGSTRIAIRMESPSSGYFAYNWFWNNTAP